MSFLLALAVAAKTKQGGALWIKAKASARVVAYGTVVAVGLSALMARNAVANVEEGSLHFGRELDKVTDLLGDTKEVKLNGEPIYFSQSTSKESVATILDRFAAHCSDDPAMKGLDWDDVADSTIKPNSESTAGIDTMRKEDKNDGVVLCFRRSENNKTKNFLEALQDFNTTHDFGSIGGLRYVHVSRGEGQAQSSIQVVWTNGSFKMDKVMPPEDGTDAPGSDPVGIPRPERSQRILTATATGTIYAVRMYRTTDSVDKALAAYDAQMDAKDWAIIQPPAAVAGSTVGHWYERDGAQSMLSVSSDDQGRTVLTIGELGPLEKTPTKEVVE